MSRRILTVLAVGLFSAVVFVSKAPGQGAAGGCRWYAVPNYHCSQVGWTCGNSNQDLNDPMAVVPCNGRADHVEQGTYTECGGPALATTECVSGPGVSPCYQAFGCQVLGGVCVQDANVGGALVDAPTTSTVYNSANCVGG